MDYFAPLIRDRLLASAFAAFLPAVLPSVQTIGSWAMAFIVLMVVYEMVRNRPWKDTVVQVLFTIIIVQVMLRPSSLVSTTADILDSTGIVRTEVLEGMRSWGLALERTRLEAAAAASASSAAGADSKGTGRRSWFYG